MTVCSGHYRPKLWKEIWHLDYISTLDQLFWKLHSGISPLFCAIPFTSVFSWFVQLVSLSYYMSWSLYVLYYGHPLPSPLKNKFCGITSLKLGTNNFIKNIPFHSLLLRTFEWHPLQFLMFFHNHCHLFQNRSTKAKRWRIETALTIPFLSVAVPPRYPFCKNTTTKNLLQLDTIASD